VASEQGSLVASFSGVFSFQTKRAQCLLLAQSEHSWLHRTCPLLGVKRTCIAAQMSAFDPKRTDQ
jgi:hypothetical protein